MDRCSTAQTDAVVINSNRARLLSTPAGRVPPLNRPMSCIFNFFLKTSLETVFVEIGESVCFTSLLIVPETFFFDLIFFCECHGMTG